MIDLEAIALRRADEQCAAERIKGYHEADSWDVTNPSSPPARKKARAKCFACDRKAVSHGYCHPHWMQVTRDQPVDELPFAKGNGARFKGRRKGAA